MLKGTESWFLIWEGIYKVKFRFLISTTLLITFLLAALSIVWLPSFPPTHSIIPILLFICFYYTFWSKARCFFVPTGGFLMTYNKWWCYILVSQQTVQVLQTLNDSLTEINATDIKAQTQPLNRLLSFVCNTYSNEDQMKMFDSLIKSYLQIFEICSSCYKYVCGFPAFVMSILSLTDG